MSEGQRLATSQIGDVTVVRFAERRILDDANIQGIGLELFALVDEGGCERLLLNFADVEFLSSSALGKLITLHRKLRARGGMLKLSNIRPEIYDVLAITRLNELFAIYEEEAEALAAFEKAGSGLANEKD